MFKTLGFQFCTRSGGTVQNLARWQGGTERPLGWFTTCSIANFPSTKTSCLRLSHAFAKPSGPECWIGRAGTPSCRTGNLSLTVTATMSKLATRAPKIAGQVSIRPSTLTWSSGLAYGLLKVSLSGTLNLTAAGKRPDPLSADHQKEMTATYRNTFLRLIWFLWETIRIFLRALRLFLTFFPLLCLYPVTTLHRRLSNLWWMLALWAIECSGPVFIKLGQWSSTRRDLFSLEFCDQFSKLQKHVRPHSWSYTTKRLEAAFGPRWRHFLVHFDEDRQPIGSGCVAQVYRAYLRTDVLERARRDHHQQSTTFKSRLLEILEQLQSSTDKLSDEVLNHHLPRASGVTGAPDYTRATDNLVPVAVKVLHPGIHTAFRRDLFIMMTAAKILETIVPGVHWLSLSKCVEEFSGVMERQIDLSYEATNLERFAYNFRNVPSVVFPKPLRPFVTENVLVETFEEGDPMVLFTSNGNYTSALKAKLADIGIGAVIKMVFEDNFVHGDLHPGNVLVQNATLHETAVSPKMRALDILDTVILSVKQPPPLRLVFLDCGITATLGQRDLDNFHAVFTAIALGNGEEVGDLFLTHSTEVKCNDEVGFRKDMAKIVDSFNNTQRFKDMDVSTVINNLFSTLMKHHVKLESNFATVILAMMVVEGLGHALNPDLDLLKKARPILLANVKRTFAMS